MMTSIQLRTLLNNAMTQAGFAKQDRAWTRRTNELLWIVQLDRSPYGERFSLDIGVAILKLLADAAPAKASDCPVLVHLENLPLAAPPEAQDTRFGDFRSATIVSFDLAHDMEDGERRQILTSITETLGAYIRGIENEQDLRVRYEMGDFKSALIRNDVKQRLIRSA